MTNKTLIAVVALFVFGAPASAQNSPAAQPLPGLNNFSIPSSRPAPRRVPDPEPTVRPTASATPRVFLPAAVPTVRATPAPRATPTPRAAAPKVVAVPVPARAAPVALPTSQPRPVPIPVPQPSPSALATTLPPVDVPTSAPATPEPVPTVAPVSQGAPAATPFWIWALAACLPLALVIGSFGWWWPRLVRSRVRGDEVSDDREILVLTDEEVPAPPPVAPIAPLAPRPPAPWLTGDRATLDLELIPTRAGTDATGLSVDYLIVVRNIGKAPASNIRLDVRLLGAGPNQDATIAALFAPPITKPISPPFDLPAGSTIELGGSGTHPRETLDVMTIAGQTAAVPVLAVNLHYDWPGGGHGQTAQSYVIGIARGAEAKLQPFPLDPPRMYASVSALDYTVSVVS